MESGRSVFKGGSNISIREEGRLDKKMADWRVRMIESAVGVELVPVLGPFLWSAGGGYRLRNHGRWGVGFSSNPVNCIYQGYHS